MIRDVVCSDVEGLAGGKGIAHMYHVLSKEELNGHGRLYARVVLEPGCSVGWHQHIHDTEPYYILKGEGDFFEGDSQDGERRMTRVHAGQVCLIEVGQWHSIENNSGENLEFMGLIYNERGYQN